MSALSSASRDERLAELLAELTRRHRQGEALDLSSVVGQHADLADELRELWPAVLLAEELARPSADPGATLDPQPAAAAPPWSLPRSFGDYELLEELGRGGMGVVFKARQKSLDRIVAVKMILRGTLASASDLARFRAEAEAAARLDHPNIVAVYEVGEHDGQPYFSMQYVEGTTLAARVAQGPLPTREAARLLVDICRGVHRAHQNGILHRDLKPSNILLAVGSCQLPVVRQEAGTSKPLTTDNWQLTTVPKITDFGLAKRVEGDFSLTRTGAIVGTPSYMSPEQAAGSRGVLSPASDVYSLGCILYEMLTGKPPFQAASAVDTIMLVLEQEPLPPRLLNSRIERDLEMICLKCLQKPPGLRYAGADKLADDLEAFLQGEPVSASKSSLTYLLARWFRETHHAAVLENWGVLWMWHSLVLVVLCTLTNWFRWRGITTVGPYLALWIFGLGTWGAIFLALRRRGGPVTFIERQIVHVWVASTIGSISLFVVESMLGLEVLQLSPVLGVMAGMVFLVKAGMLSGSFYVSSGLCFLTAVLMAVFPDIGVFLFGLVTAACFFIPGLKYYRQRRTGAVTEEC